MTASIGNYKGNNVHFLLAFGILLVAINESQAAGQENWNDSRGETGILRKWVNDGKAVTNRTVQNNRKDTSVLAIESSLTVISHSTFPKNKLFCRVKGACRVGDGTVLLPQWMRSYSAHISNCGFKKVGYHIADVRGALGGTFIGLRGIDMAMSLKDDFRDHDVIGNEPPRGERSLLASDVTPTILLLDLFRRPGAYAKVTTSLCATKFGKSCKAENGTDPLSFNPMILVDSQIAGTKDYMWPKSLLRLLRNAVAGDLRITDLKELYSWKVRSQASCFRSLISTNVGTVDIPPGVMMSTNVFFSKNSLRRTAIGKTPGSISDTCSVNVLILNRYGKRFIEGSEKLRDVISFLARRVRKVDERVVIQPEVVFFEHSSFHEQVSVMQESSVVVASHGDGNANFLFLRPQSRVFEILPFGFSSDMYKNISRVYGSIHSFVWGQPDKEVFLACLLHFNPVASKERDAFISDWQAAATKFTEETKRRNANIPTFYNVPHDEDEPDVKPLQRLRQCASYQRITVNIKHLAKVVTKAAVAHCNVQGHINFLDT